MHPYHLIHVPQPEPGELYPKRWAGLVFLCFAVLVSAFEMTVTSAALPVISHALKASTSDLQLIVDSYAIVFAGLLLFGGGLADRYGRKGAFLGGLVVFGISSAFGAFAQSPQQLIVARALMGLGAALFLPPTLSILTVLFPKEERPKAIGVWAAFGGIGIALGPVIAGFLLGRFWWGSVFFVAVPCCAIAALGAAVLIPTSRRPHTPSVDWVGAALSVGGLATFLYGIIEGPNFGWLDQRTLVTLVAGLAILVAYVLWELRTPYPMFDVRVFAIPEVIAGATALFLLYVGFLGLLFVVPQYLQFVERHSAFMTGLLMVPLGGTFALFSQLSPKVLKRFGVRATLVASMLLMGGGLAVISLLRWAGGYGVIAVGEALFGLGIALAMPPASAAVINALPVEKAGDGADVNLITRQLGGAFGVALLGSVFASVYASHISDALTGTPPAAAHAAERSIVATIALAQALGGSAHDALLGRADGAFEVAAQSALLTAAVLCVLGGVLTLTLLKKKGSGAPAQAGEGLEPATAG